MQLVAAATLKRKKRMPHRVLPLLSEVQAPHRALFQEAPKAPQKLKRSPIRLRRSEAIRSIDFTSLNITTAPFVTQPSTITPMPTSVQKKRKLEPQCSADIQISPLDLRKKSKIEEDKLFATVAETEEFDAELAKIAEKDIDENVIKAYALPAPSPTANKPLKLEINNKTRFKLFNRRTGELRIRDDFKQDNKTAKYIFRPIVYTSLAQLPKNVLIAMPWSSETQEFTYYFGLYRGQQPFGKKGAQKSIRTEACVQWLNKSKTFHTLDTAVFLLKKNKTEKQSLETLKKPIVVSDKTFDV